MNVNELPPYVLVVLGVLGVVQVSLLAWALVDLLRRDRVAGGRKWVWLVVVLFLNTIGPIIYLAVGRKVPPEAADPLAAGATTDDRDRVERAADTLYGRR